MIMFLTAAALAGAGITPMTLDEALAHVRNSGPDACLVLEGTVKIVTDTRDSGYSYAGSVELMNEAFDMMQAEDTLVPDLAGALKAISRTVTRAVYHGPNIPSYADSVANTLVIACETGDSTELRFMAGE